MRKDVEAGLSLSDCDGAPPEGLQPAVHRDDPRGGDRRRARGLAAARRRPAREGRLAAPPDPLGDDLPDHGDGLRGGHHDGARRLPRAGLRGRLQAVRRRTAGDHEGLGGDVPRGHQLLVGAVRRRRRRLHRLPEVEGILVGAPAVGPLPPARPDEDRRDRAGGGDRALVAHARLAHLRRRAAAARARDHRQDRRQRRRRGRDGERHRLGQARRHDRRAARERARSSR